MFRFFARLFGRTETQPTSRPNPPETLMHLHGDQAREAQEHRDRKRNHDFAFTLFHRIKGRPNETD